VTFDPAQASPYLTNSSPSQTFSLPLFRKYFQLDLFILVQRLAVAYFIIMRWELGEELFQAMLLAHGIDVRNGRLGKVTKVEVNLGMGYRKRLANHSPRNRFLQDRAHLPVPV